jgi:hypothetical protein
MSRGLCVVVERSLSRRLRRFTSIEKVLKLSLPGARHDSRLQMVNRQQRQDRQTGLLPVQCRLQVSGQRTVAADRELVAGKPVDAEIALQLKNRLRRPIGIDA